LRAPFFIASWRHAHTLFSSLPSCIPQFVMFGAMSRRKAKKAAPSDMPTKGILIDDNDAGCWGNFDQFSMAWDIDNGEPVTKRETLQ
jgi:hypothetical protein